MSYKNQRQRMCKKEIILFFFIIFVGNTSFAQRKIDIDISMSGFVSTTDSLPFWAVTNRHGLIPDTDGGVLFFGLKSDFNSKNELQFAYGASGAVQLSEGGYKFKVDELYLSSFWKVFRLDVGMQYRGAEFQGLGISNGNIVYSGNSRNMPGYNFSIKPFPVPYTNKKLWIYCNYSDYMMIDNRYVRNTLVHNQSLYFRIDISPRVDLHLGFEDWAQWGGTNPDGTINPSGFNDYLRIITGRAGAENASSSDQANVLGNHLGREIIKINYRADDYTLTVQHDIPFEDGSGMGFQNFPDGINTVYFSFNDKNRWVSDIVYEYIYTKSQSGDAHERPATDDEMAHQNPSDSHYGIIILGGLDDYFNHSSYKSGWTYFGRTIGLPLFIPNTVDEEGIVKGGIVNNRITAHHIGISGNIARLVPYRLMLTWSKNFGRYNQTYQYFNDAPQQFSFGLEGEFPKIKELPIIFNYGIYGDIGNLYPVRMGFCLGIKYNCSLFLN